MSSGRIKEYFIYISHVVKSISLKVPLLKIMILKFQYRKNFYLGDERLNELIEEKITKSHDIYNNIINKIKKYDKSYVVNNKIVLEIGPGNDLLVALIFLLNGAKKVYLVDKFKRIHDDIFNSTLFQRYLDYYNKKIDLRTQNYLIFKKNIVYFQNNPFENFSKIKNESIDLLFSNAVLEHINKLNLTIKKIYSLLKKGGYTFHQIDLRDHYQMEEKGYLNLLKFSPKIWKIIGNTNQYRYNHYLNLFVSYNFKIIEINTDKIKDLVKVNKLKKDFYKKYRELNNTELSIIGFNITALKV